MDVKRPLSASQGKERYAALIVKPETNPAEIYLDTHDFPPPLNSETPETQRNHRLNRYSGRFRRPRVGFKMDPTLKRINRKLLPGGVG
ncbi:unnamed protein product [Hymenolepis diminuta]|uniref:Uncharacterized protein n=1 Tax=Hymenolepis diminuta TaxID=6216 RepID=A0A564YP47_HYMDI|nr:unnamed protein product [Hymenolepis diminuta]